MLAGKGQVLRRLLFDPAQPRFVSLATGFKVTDDTPHMFSDLEKSDLKKLLARFRLRKYLKGQTIFVQGDYPMETYIVSSGMVQTYSVTESGRQYTKGYWSDYEIVGVPDMFSTEPRIISAKSVTDCELLGFTQNDLAWAIRSVPLFAYNMARTLANNVRKTTLACDWMSTHPVWVRVALTLSQQNREHGEISKNGDFHLTYLTHSDIARMVGASRQWVTKSLTILEEMNLIECKRRCIILHDVSGLEELGDRY